MAVTTEARSSAVTGSGRSARRERPAVKDRKSSASAVRMALSAGRADALAKVLRDRARLLAGLGDGGRQVVGRRPRWAIGESSEHRGQVRLGGRSVVERGEGGEDRGEVRFGCASVTELAEGVEDRGQVDLVAGPKGGHRSEDWGQIQLGSVAESSARASRIGARSGSGVGRSWSAARGPGARSASGTGPVVAARSVLRARARGRSRVGSAAPPAW